jgi:hypothetical protein
MQLLVDSLRQGVQIGGPRICRMVNISIDMIGCSGDQYITGCM